jgi:outer membrane protein
MALNALRKRFVFVGDLHVRLRHWQAATCVALTLFSSVSPLLAEGYPQQTGKSQTQLENEFDALAPTTMKKTSAPSTTRPGTVSQGSAARPSAGTSEITIPAGTVRPGTNVRPGTVVPASTATSQTSTQKAITSLPQPDDSAPVVVTPKAAPVSTRTATAPVPAVTQPAPAAVTRPVTVQPKQVTPAVTVQRAPAPAPAPAVAAPIVVTPVQATQEAPAADVHPIVLPEPGAVAPAASKTPKAVVAKTPKAKASKKTAPTEDTEEVVTPVAPPPPVVRPVVTIPSQQTQVNPTMAAPSGTIQNDTTGAKGLPQAPGPTLTEPLYLRPSAKDYGKGKAGFVNPLLWYTPKDYPQPRLSNSPRLDDLLRDGKIYLSLSDAVTLALENNYDIAIARINLDIADTDLLRAKAGSSLRGVSTGIVANTLGGSTTTISGGGGPGGTSSGTGGGGAGASGLVLSTSGGGPVPETLDPLLTGNLEYEAAIAPSATALTGAAQSIYTDTGTYNFTYAQGFLTGTQFTTTFTNSRVSTNNSFDTYVPFINTAFRVQATQHLLQGFGTGINGRFILQAKNDRRITDSAFRQQVLYTVNQVENIYWGLVSAYEDEQAKERALKQSSALTADNRRQLEIGTLAPLDVVNSDATVATDRQALIASQTNLEYQQLIMKQAIARNLTDPQLSGAPVIPTDRVGLDRLKEEDMPVEDLVREAYQNNPQIEQAVLNMKNNQITIKAEKNGLLPIVDVYGFYGASQLAGAPNANLSNLLGTGTAPAAPVTYGTAFGDLFNNSTPDKGVGVNISIPLRNRTAQADQMRSQMELRQSQMRLQQLYTQIRIQVINGQYALTNDRAQVAAAQASRDYAVQSSEAEQKKFRLGASTSAAVLQQQRSLANAENTLISATAAYAKDRAALMQLVSNTLETYGINLTAAAAGTVGAAPVIPGLTAPKPQAPARPLR